MGAAKKSAKFEADGFIKGLRGLLDTLPSELQKQEINNALTELIGFLTNLRNTFQAIPSSEDVSQVNQSLLKLEELFDSVEKIPAIAASLGIDRKSTKRSASAKSAKGTEIDVTGVLAALTKLPADEIRSQLVEIYSKPDLLAIALELGMKPDKRASQKSLADKIASEIVNQRMRDSLAGRSNREAAGN